MVRQHMISYTDLEETYTDDESEICHQTEPQSKTKKVSKTGIGIKRCLRNSLPNSRLNLHRRRCTEPSQPLLVLDPAALEVESRFIRFPSTLNIDSSVVHVGNDVTTVNNTIYEPGTEGNFIKFVDHHH